ncbi:MAG: hypothetical protein V1908_00710 [Candidatus Peregrinibacteria bacterium]
MEAARAALQSIDGKRAYAVFCEFLGIPEGATSYPYTRKEITLANGICVAISNGGFRGAIAVKVQQKLSPNLRGNTRRHAEDEWSIDHDGQIKLEQSSDYSDGSRWDSNYVVMGLTKLLKAVSDLPPETSEQIVEGRREATRQVLRSAFQ